MKYYDVRENRPSLSPDGNVAVVGGDDYNIIITVYMLKPRSGRLGTWLR